MRSIFRHQLNEVISILNNQDRQHKSFYYFCKKYKVLKSDPYQLVEIGEEDKVVVCLEEMFDACKEIHKKVGFTGRSAMEPMAKQFYSKVTRPIIEIFLNYSKEYHLKRKKAVNHGLVVKPIISSYYNSRMQIDLVDFQSLPDGEHKWILNAQDHMTKFCHLRPLKEKSASCVAWALYKIFSRCGAPLILQSDNGKEFRNSLISSLKVLWPDLQIVHGHARTPQTQGSVERSNGDFQGNYYK